MRLTDWLFTRQKFQVPVAKIHARILNSPYDPVKVQPRPSLWLKRERLHRFNAVSSSLSWWWWTARHLLPAAYCHHYSVAIRESEVDGEGGLRAVEQDLHLHGHAKTGPGQTRTSCMAH